VEEMIATGNGFEEVPVAIREEAYHVLVFTSCCFCASRGYHLCVAYCIAYCIATLARC